MFPVRTNLSGYPDGLSGRALPRATRSASRSAPCPAVFPALRRASARHDHLEQAAVWTPLPRHAPPNRGGSTGPRRRSRITGAVLRGRKSTAAEPRGRLHVPHQRDPGIAGNATLQSPVPVPRAPPREGEEAAMPPMPVNSGGHCCYGMCELWASRSGMGISQCHSRQAFPS